MPRDRIGKIWEGLRSGQSPLQPVDAPLLPATRRVMPAAHAQCRCGFAAFCRHAQCCCNGRQCSQKLPNLLKISQNIPIKAAINRIVGLAPTCTENAHRKPQKNTRKKLRVFSKKGKKNGIPTGIRTLVAGMKTRCPRPLDDRDAVSNISLSCL